MKSKYLENMTSVRCICSLEKNQSGNSVFRIWIMLSCHIIKFLKKFYPSSTTYWMATIRKNG